MTTHVHRARVAGRRTPTRDPARRPTVASARTPPAQGRDAVRTALLDAAAVLFSERGPASVSVRDIAAHAGVNHGLVHRHFGSKQALVAGVLERGAREIAAAVAGTEWNAGALGAVFAAAGARDAYWRLLARALLDGARPHELQHDFPTGRLLVETFRERRRSGTLAADFDPKLVAAGTMALGLGWLLFEPFVLAATGLDGGDRDAVRLDLIRALVTLLERMGDT
jgi:AcrR family transcriptional regulator